MVKKQSQSAADEGTGNVPPSGMFKDSAAQQIWLAGLGAFAKAQEEGSKVFEALVKEGLAIQRKTQSAAEERFSEVTNRMADMASDLSARATGKWDKLEGIFENRVARALKTLGVPSAKDVEALAARLDELARSVDKLSGAAKPGAARRVGAKKAPAAKRTAARKSAAD